MLKKTVKVKRSSIHGRGVFALKNIKAGELIGIFEGKITSRDGTHVLWLPDEDGNLYGIKGKNSLRYLNHSLVPNAEFNDEGELHAVLDISPDEELTIHYGDEWIDTP